MENVNQEQEQKIKELHSALLMAKKDADESKTKESEETKNKAKEVLKKTNEKYKKLIHGLKARHKEEMASLETSIQAKQEETMKASMLEYENTISELRMNENIAQQKLEKLQGKTKEMEAQVKEAVEIEKEVGRRTGCHYERQ